MRSMFALAASGMAGLAAVVASADGDSDIVPFFVGLTFLGGVAAWAAHEPFEGSRAWAARAGSLAWTTAAAWVAVLLAASMTIMQAASPPPAPEDTYVGLTATAYHAIGLFGGAVLMIACAFAPTRWLDGHDDQAGRAGSQAAP